MVNGTNTGNDFMAYTDDDVTKADRAKALIADAMSKLEQARDIGLTLSHPAFDTGVWIDDALDDLANAPKELQNVKVRS